VKISLFDYHVRALANCAVYIVGESMLKISELEAINNNKKGE